MRNTIILLFSLLISLYLYSSQEQECDKDALLSQQLLKDQDFILNEPDTHKVDVFLYDQLSKDLNKAKNDYITYLERGIADNNEKVLYNSYFYLGYIDFILKHYKTASDYANLAINSAKTLNDQEKIISSLSLSGSIYYNNRDYNNSIDQFLKAYNIVKQFDLKEYKIPILTNIGMIRVDSNRHEDALKIYLEILALLEKDENKGIPSYNETYLSSLLSAGICFYKTKDYKSALEYYTKGFNLSKVYNLEKYTTTFHMTMAETYIDMSEYELAYPHLNKAKSKLNGVINKRDPKLLTTNYHFAKYHFKKKQYKEALLYLSENFEIVQKDNRVDKIDEMYNLAIQSAEKLGDTEKQILYGKAYRAIIDSLHQDSMKAKDKLYDQDIEDLEEKNESLSSINVIYIISTITIFVCLSITLLYSLRTKRKNKLLFEKLLNEKSKDAPAMKKDFITDTKVKIFFEKLHELEKTNFFLKNNCNLYTTAKLIDTNTTYLSKIINEYKQQSFNDYINKLRINYCRKRLRTDSKFRSYTIKAIAEDLGYKSVNTFSSAFRKQTGLRHSFYIKQLSMELNELRKSKKEAEMAS